jgi:hypothetical protein
MKMKSKVVQEKNEWMIEGISCFFFNSDWQTERLPAAQITKQYAQQLWRSAELLIRC